MAEYRVRRMRREDVDLAIEWAAAEGWNPGLNDAESFFDTDPQGFFIGSLTANRLDRCRASLTEPVSASSVCILYGHSSAGEVTACNCGTR